jgi:hypothetical protein
MNRTQEAAELANDLELLGHGSVSEDEFRARYSSRQDATVATTVWPYLEHFLSDADIRARDEDYRTMQEAELAKLVSLLRADAPDSELCKVTFLGYSRPTNAG